MEKNVNVYLAGDVSQHWRAKVESAFRYFPNVIFLSPNQSPVAYKREALITKAPFIIADKIKIDRSDIIFAYLKKYSPSRFSGTSWELGRASMCPTKHAIVVCDLSERLARLYEFLRSEYSNTYFTSLEDGMRYLARVLCEMIGHNSHQLEGMK